MADAWISCSKTCKFSVFLRTPMVVFLPPPIGLSAEEPAEEKASDVLNVQMAAAQRQHNQIRASEAKKRRKSGATWPGSGANAVFLEGCELFGARVPVGGQAVLMSGRGQVTGVVRSYSTTPTTPSPPGAVGHWAFPGNHLGHAR